MSHFPISRLAGVLFVTLSLFQTGASAQSVEPELHIGKFSSKDLTGWKDQSIFSAKNGTSYSFVQDNGKSVLMARCTDGASGLIRKIEIVPKAYPVISWWWKIDHTIRKGNERVKDGHDFSARLYVIFPRGLFSSTRVIEYVWGNVMHKGESIRSPYSNNIVMIAVNSGDDMAGHWIYHKRNYAEDYRAAFGEETPKVGAIAIMTDCDNTHETATGYYGDIRLLPVAREGGQKAKEPVKPKEPLPKEAPLKEQPKKEQPPQPEPKPKELPPKEQPKPEPKPKEQPNGTGHSVPPPAVPPSPPPAPGAAPQPAAAR